MSLGPERVDSLRRPLSTSNGNFWDRRAPGVLQVEPRKMQMYQELLLSGKQMAGGRGTGFPSCATRRP